MNWKDYTAMSSLVLAILAAGLHAVWHSQSRQPKNPFTDYTIIEQTANNKAITPLAPSVSPAPERTEPTPQEAVTAICATPGVVAQLPDAPASTSAQPVTPEPFAPASPTHLVIEATPISVLPAALQQRFPSARTIEPVRITSLADQLALYGSPDEPQKRLQLPAPHGRTVDVIILQHRQIHARRGTITGTVDGIAHSEVIVSYAEEAMTASVIIPGTENIEIAYAGNGCHLLLDIDPAKILPSAQPLIPVIEVAKSSLR